MGNLCVDLRVELAGIRLRNPLVLASGILGTTISLLKRVEKAGAGAVTTKTLTLRPRPGYPNPVLVELDFGFVNAMGLPNPGVDYFLDELYGEQKVEIEIPVIISIGGGSAEEFSVISSKLRKYPVEAVELNLSCPHVKGHGLELGSDPEAVYEVVSSIRSNLPHTPLFVKLSANVASVLDIAEAALRAGASGFVAINTLRAMVIDIYAKKPVLSNVYGGLSGPAIRPVAVRVVYELYENFPRVPIIGVGGVDSWHAAVEFLLAGASAVGIGSVIARKDLAVFDEILKGLKTYLKAEGYERIGDIVGLAHRD